jgi:hypothetical protein
MNLVSKAEYARMRGCTPQTINSFINEGLIILVGKKVNVDESNKNLSDIYDSANYDFNEAKTREKNFQAKTAELEYEMLAGSLIKRETVERDAYEIAIKVKNQILALPTQMSNDLVIMIDKKEIELYLKDKFVSALENLEEKYGQ